MKLKELGSIRNTAIGFALIILCFVAAVIANAAPIDAVQDTRQPDTLCANGLWAVGECPDGYALSTEDPVIFYSDLTAAPKTGWSEAEPNKGACVSIWGRNFGSVRGLNFVSVGNVDLTSASDYCETWGEERPIPGQQKVSFWLNSSMVDGANTISITVNGIESEAIPFRVNSTGDIWFVDNSLVPVGDGSYETPFNYLGGALGNVGAGDVAYIKDGTYTDLADGGGAIIWVRDSRPAGTADAPIAFVAYPDAEPLLDILSYNSSSYHTGIRVDNTYYTISKLSILAYENGIVAGGEGVRVVGNSVDAANVYRSGAGSIVGSRDSVKILGNEVHGADSGNQQDHAIYLAGCSPNVGMEVAYNWVYDNDIAEGPSIVVNHQDARCPDDVRLASHYIHNNFVDCTAHDGRGIGLYDQSWDSGVDTAGEPQPTYVYNNIVNGCGYEGQPSSYQNSAHGKWFNNTFYNIGSVTSSGLSISGARTLSSEVKNNIFHKSGATGIYYAGNSPTFTSSNNLYFGAGDGPAEDTSAVNADPLITMDAANASLSIASNSPANEAGDNTLSDVARDYFGKLRQLIVDIGAAIVGDD